MKFKETPATIFLPFFLVHSSIFFLAAYFISRSSPIGALGLAFFSTIVYAIFYYMLFEKGYRSAMLDAAISIVTGLIFGDWLMDRFYPESLLTNHWHNALMILLVFNIYTFINLVRYLINPQNPQLGSDDKRRQKIALWGSLTGLGILFVSYFIYVFDFNYTIQDAIAGKNHYHDSEFGFTVSFPVIKMHKTWAEKTTSTDAGIPETIIRFYWDAAGTRWAEPGFDPFLIRVVNTSWWNAQTPDTQAEFGFYLGQNNQFTFVGVRGVECPSVENQLTGEITDSALCALNQGRDYKEIFRDFRLN